MPDDPLPPLRVRNVAGTFNQMPVFELEVSGGTLSKISSIRTRLVVDSGGAGSSVVYAATGNQYLTVAAAGDLTAERVLTASTGISLTSDSTTVFVHYGSFLVTSSRAINTTFPLSGGANLSADRTLVVDTAFLVTSAITITAGVGITGGGNLGASRTLDLSTGNTGQYMVTSAGATEGIAWINTAGAGGGPVYAATGNQYVTIGSATDLTDAYLFKPSTGISLTSANNQVFVHYGSLLVTSSRALSTTYPLSGGGNLSADRTLFIQTGAAGTVLISSANGVGWVTSQNVPQITTVRIPMALSTVQPTTGNAYWVGRTSPTIDVSYLEYLDSGNGLATYWATVPNNLAPSPLWNLRFYHMPSTGSGGNVVLSVSAMVVAAGGSIGNGALTTMMNAVALSTRAADVLEISTGSATNFDGTLALAANNYLACQVWRIGGNANDTLGQPWDLYALQLQCDVLT